jgi:hypothetical protein
MADRDPARIVARAVAGSIGGVDHEVREEHRRGDRPAVDDTWSGIVEAGRDVGDEPRGFTLAGRPGGIADAHGAVACDVDGEGRRAPGPAERQHADGSTPLDGRADPRVVDVDPEVERHHPLLAARRGATLLRANGPVSAQVRRLDEKSEREK